MEFKVGDTVRVNYYAITDISRTATGNTVLEPSTNFTWWDGDLDTGQEQTTDGRYRITLKALDSTTPTYDSGSWTAPNIRKERHQISAEDEDLTYELRNVPESYVQQLDVTTTYDDRRIENIVRNLTVLKVFKTTFNGDTLFEVTFNDSINVTPSSYDKVSFEIIARVQNPISRCSQLKKDIYVYSFSLEPEDHQPSGSCNFSRIDSAKIILSSSCSISNIYAVNYNVLRILSGMGGLAYSS